MEGFDFNRQLRKEILLSEKLRAILLGGVAACAILVLLVIHLVFTEDLKYYFVHTEYIYIIQAIFFLFVIRELIVIKYINKKISAGEEVKDRARYITSLIEVSLPSVILITIGFFLETTEVLISPVIFLYFIIIILSTLSLDFKISVSIAIIAAVEYLVVFLILNSQFKNPIEDIAYNSIIFHLGKANLIIVSGVISGLVAEQIKKKMIRVNKTLIERNKIINMFGQQISSSIVKYLIENDNEIKSERKYVCVMFLDIRGFTKFAESRQPEEIINYQNDLFPFMINIINKHNGIINQFLGDGYMATFGAPVSSSNDSQNALDAALEIISVLEEKIKNKKVPYTKIGIGLHSGYVVAGNVGTEVRKQYSISGNTVILASRIEQLNKEFNSQLLISKEVYELVKTNQESIINHGKVNIKGREEPIEIFEIK